jgi:hypothetical protein
MVTRTRGNLTHIHTYTHTHKHRQTHRHTDTQTHTHTHIHTLNAHAHTYYSELSKWNLSLNEVVNNFNHYRPKAIVDQVHLLGVDNFLAIVARIARYRLINGTWKGKDRGWEEWLKVKKVSVFNFICKTNQ